MPEFIELEMDQPSLKTPILRMLDEDASDLNEYLDDPIDPVRCVPEQDHERYWEILKSLPESSLGGPGSTELLAVLRTFRETNLGCQNALHGSLLVHA